MIDASAEGEGGVIKLSNDQIIAQSTGFLLAGYETTANTLAYTAYLLALHPQVQERLQREIDSYMENNPVQLPPFFPPSPTVSPFTFFESQL